MARDLKLRTKILPAALMLLSLASTVNADTYRDEIQPYLKKHCVDCHAGETAKGQLDLTRFSGDEDVVQSFRRWRHIIQFVRDGEMPPEDYPQPSIAENNAVVSAIQSILITEARKQAGDPGVVPARRLSKTEYDHAIRDLTGVEIRPTQDFPADPAGGEGFDNTGEALRMSPNLLKKYLVAAQRVADHLVLKPDGIVFAPFPVQSYNERKKLTEQAIIDFYESHTVDVAAYLEAAWRYRYRDNEQQHERLEQWASTNGLSQKYLSTVWNYLSGLKPASPFESELHRRWDEIPAPGDATGRPAELISLIRFIESSRLLLSPPESQLIRSNAGNWPISHLDFRSKIAQGRDRFDASVLQRERLLRTARVSRPDRSAPKPRTLYLQFSEGFSTGPATVLVQNAIFSQSDRLPRNDEERSNQEVETLRSVLERSAPAIASKLQFGKRADGAQLDPDSFIVQVPASIEIPFSVELQQELEGRHLLLPCQLDQNGHPNSGVVIQATWSPPEPDRWTSDAELLIDPDSTAARELTAAGGPFFRTFPKGFFYVNESRGLAAGFHLVEGFFRDDRPLVEKVLSDDENAELDRLWQELDFVTESAETLLRGFVWFERSEREVLHDERFDFLRSEDPELVNESLLGRFERAYLDKLGIKRIGDSLEAERPDDRYAMVHGFFNDIRAGLATHRELLAGAEATGLDNLEAFAHRAWRRPLREEEKQSLRSLYQSFRVEGQNVEEALRGLLTAVLMSPHFCYHAPAAPAGQETSPLSDIDLASRLSLFLWSSVPDDELLAAAEQHQLSNEEQLLDQLRRMLQSPAMSAFSREFLGQWLRYRDYLDKDPINAAAFPGYDDDLRLAMAEEPVYLTTWLIQQDRPITDLLGSDLTFVNRRLAAHYGGAIEQSYSAQWKIYRGDQKSPDEVWFPVEGLTTQGRGGLFGMAVVLTKNSSGERTSPVKRGFWTVHHLLGQHFPPPPADVPELPKSEQAASRTIRELLADHVADAKCAMCHKHFDSLGLAMEGFDAIGRARTKDSAGRTIDNRAQLPDGEFAQGIPELIDYVREQRRDEFVKTFCRKFLGYALGRSVILSDEPLLEEMETNLKRNDYRFSAVFETVVRSPQFRRQRGRDYAVKTRP